MTSQIKNFYTNIYKKYEFVNHLFTLYMDIKWRKETASHAAKRKGLFCLDVCTGTAEMAVALKEQMDKSAVVIATDFSKDMIKQGKMKHNAEGITFILADAAKLPFKDNVFDIITISFATRNLQIAQSLEIYFKEFYRIITGSGMFLQLETSQPSNRFINCLFRQYVKLSVFSIGKVLTGKTAPYRFLASSVTGFYNSEQLASIIKQAGFDKVTWRPFMFGSVSLHCAEK